ncbi:lactonase family protein [Georgenia satyanarayanai]|uniref:lactonase family protein n=1 Tax=Georgenia satyanarayanai TaxID=860221 RepID=UPI00203F5A61|nr:beta-propeller fold lactonase family protein [Georgenia satyanarayanai]MCM3660274.1 lactonase family protein [Georgenia satyanarayanai]
MHPTHRLWVGTYPDGGNGARAGRGEGVWSVGLDMRSRRLGRPRLMVAAPAPSFLAEHSSGRVLYALSETDPGTLSALAVDAGGGLSLVGTVPSGGSGPCHLLVTDRAVYVSHYGDGSLAVHRLAADGTFAAQGPAQVHGAAQRAGPAAVSRAHFAALAPGGHHLLVCDLGLDVLRRYRIVQDGLLVGDGTAARLPRGTGPRHLAVGTDGLLHVAGELDATLTTLAWDAGTGEANVLATVSLASLGLPAHPGHVVRLGGEVLVSVRGPDEVVVVPVSRATGGTGELRRLPSGGSWPRHFAEVDELVVVAGERSHTLALCALDGTVHDTVGIGDPACVVVAGSVDPYT